MIIRSYNPETDESFIIGTFLDSIRFNGLAVQVMSPEARKIFMDRAAKDFRKILSISDVLVAVEGEEQVPVSWASMSIYRYHKVLHYCYTTQKFRHAGYLTNIFKVFKVGKDEDIDCTYWTYNMRKYLGNYKFSYNPYNKNHIIHDAI